MKNARGGRTVRLHAINVRVRKDIFAKVAIAAERAGLAVHTQMLGLVRDWFSERVPLSRVDKPGPPPFGKEEAVDVRLVMGVGELTKLAEIVYQSGLTEHHAVTRMLECECCRVDGQPWTCSRYGDVDRVGAVKVAVVRFEELLAERGPVVEKRREKYRQLMRQQRADEAAARLLRKEDGLPIGELKAA